METLQKTSFDQGQEIQLTDAINTRIEAGAPAVGVSLRPNVKRYDIGNMESYSAAFTEFALQDPLLGQAVRKATTQSNAPNP